MTWKSLLVLIFLLPTTALAECPAKAGLPKGIIFVSNVGSFVRYRALSDDIIEMDTRFSDKTGNRMQMAHGLYPIDVVRFSTTGALDPASRHVFATQQTALAWPEPRADSGWALPGDGGGTATAGPPEMIHWGDCDYEVFEAKLIFAGEAGYVEGYQYLPKLGIALLTTIHDGNGTTRFQYTLVTK